MCLSLLLLLLSCGVRIPYPIMMCPTPHHSKKKKAGMVYLDCVVPSFFVLMHAHHTSGISIIYTPSWPSPKPAKNKRKDQKNEQGKTGERERGSAGTAYI